MAYDKDPRVDAYLEAAPDWQREMMQRVRDLLHEAEPELEETIKRTVQPYFVLQGTVAAFLSAKDQVTVFLYDGGLAPDPEGIITGGHGNETGRMIQIRRGDPINERAMVDLFRAIIATTEPAAGGSQKAEEGLKTARIARPALGTTGRRRPGHRNPASWSFRHGDG
jgi:hypothetical protein